ncbi:MAG TPA: oligopeptide transporter, OPT family, partial [Thermoanaerobaculia bacterium]|nr:oligopeptide transporter, OPT family [Thermoanaerobaculia bacterium]
MSRQAYAPIPEGSTYDPFVPASESPLEFTAKAVVAGVLFGILFGAANAYLGLRAGLTISTSIPIAVITVAAFRLLAAAGTRATLLEANIAQTVGSASSSVASGVIFTIPALFLWNLDPTLVQMTLLAIAGGMLGVLFMIPLRKYLIDREHGKLPYPEGTACAQVLVASEVGGAKAKNVFYGLGAGALFKGLAGWAHIFPDQVTTPVPFLRKGTLGAEMSSALFGVGFILGPRVASVMVSGGLLSSLVLIPLIDWWGAGRAVPLFPETALTIAEMSPSQIWSRYVRYIGAGAVATAGIITLIKSIPTMLESFKLGTSQLKARLDQGAAAQLRTDLDMPFKVVGIGIVAVGSILILVPQVFGVLDFSHRLVATILVTIFAFFFVTVSSRIVGLVGVTSNPTSGMTIAALLGTSTIFLLLGWTDDAGKIGALTVGTVVAIAASMAGDMSQDLKTGFLLGATPRRQQAGELIGVLTSAAFVCMAVILLDRAYGFGTPELPAPQATLMKLVIEGVLEQSLPWILVLIGVGIALIAEGFKLPTLAFAVGVYLPVATMVPVFLGGLLRYFVEKKAASEEDAAQRKERGILFGSGLVGGEG